MSKTAAQPQKPPHISPVLDSIDKVDALHYRFEYILAHLGDDEALYFTLLSMDAEIQRISSDLNVAVQS